jgi:hypothetical protein
MKFIGLLISLAILGYAMSTYLGSSDLTTASPDGSQSRPKDYIDQAKRSAEAMSQSLQKGKERLDSSN